MTNAPNSPISLPRQSSLQRALSELDRSERSSSEDELSPRCDNTSTTKKVLDASKKSSLKKELAKLKAESFLQQYEQYFALRGMTKL